MLAIAGILAGGAWAGASLVGGDDPPPPPTTTPLATLRVIFPEGFTRGEMAERVGAVREIAISERNVTPRLVERAATSRRVRAPAAGRVSQGLGGQVAGGVPLPGDVRVHEADAVGEARA